MIPKKVELIAGGSEVSTTNPLPADTTNLFLQVFDYNGNKQIEYQGWATPDTATSSALWRIAKFTYNGDLTVDKIEWADGNVSFDNIWNNRASLSYS